MNWVDIGIIIIVFIPTFIGFRTGLIRAAFLFAAFFIGALISSRTPILPALFLEKTISQPNMRYLVNFAATFLIVFVAINILGGIIHRLISYTPLKWVDTWIGTGLGFLAGIVFVSFIITRLTNSNLIDSQEWFSGSLLLPILRDLFGQIFV